MNEEVASEDLLARLLAVGAPQEFLAENATVDRSLADYLTLLLEDRGLKKAQVIRESGVNATQAYDVFCGKSLPGRDRALMLTFALKCTLQETQRALRLAGASALSPKDRRDAIIIWCIDRGYTRVQCDDKLWECHERTLLGKSDGVR